MKEVEKLVKQWFSKWEEGDFRNLPVTDNFSHVSPYGTIAGKERYIELVDSNKDKFLGHRFEIHDELYGKDRACVRYTAIQDDFSLEVSEWYYINGGLIEEIVAYYNISGEISEDRKLSNQEIFE